MKKIILIILILSSFSVFAKKPEREYVIDQKPVEKTKTPSPLQIEFLKKTGIVLGEYTLAKNSNPNCIEGPLEIIDFSDELTLMLGARPLAMTIGKKKLKEKERGCVLTYETKVSKALVDEVRTSTCGKDKTIVATKVNVTKNGITYNRTTTTNKDVNEFNCVLTLKK